MVSENKPADFYAWAWHEKGMHPGLWGSLAMQSEYGQKLNLYLQNSYMRYVSSFDNSPPLNEDK